MHSEFVTACVFMAAFIILFFWVDGINKKVKKLKEEMEKLKKENEDGN